VKDAVYQEVPITRLDMMGRIRRTCQVCHKYSEESYGTLDTNWICA